MRWLESLIFQGSEGYSNGLEEARDIRIVEVRGSTPLCSTTLRSVELGSIGGRFALRVNLKDS